MEEELGGSGPRCPWVLAMGEISGAGGGRERVLWAGGCLHKHHHLSAEVTGSTAPSLTLLVIRPVISYVCVCSRHWLYKPAGPSRPGLIPLVEGTWAPSCQGSAIILRPLQVVRAPRRPIASPGLSEESFQNQL